MSTNNTSYEKAVKRVATEMPELFKQYNEIQISKNNNKIIVIIHKRKFIICNNYPFIPPKLYMNDILYSNYLKPRTPRFFAKMKTYYNTIGNSNCNCLCCNNILLDSNWSPTYHIQKIMTEIDKINIIKRNVKYEMLTEEIAKKHNLPDYIEKEIVNYLICHM